MTWFSYDPEGDGFDFHDSEEEAKAKATRGFELTCEYAGSDGWPENPTDICWGRVIERATEVSRKTAEPGSQFDEITDYALRAAPTTGTSVPNEGSA